MDEENTTTMQEVAETTETTEQTTGQEVSTETTQETAEQKSVNISETYNLDGDDDDETTETTEQTTEQAAEYAVEWPEDYAPNEAFSELVTPIAKDSGLSGKQFGEVTSKVVQALQQAEYANMEKSDAELKADWGAQYEANMKVAKKEAKWLMKEAGLTREDMAVLQSPKGMRLLYALATAHGERGAAGAAQVSASDKNWANEVMNNPSHPDYQAFFDPTHPNFKRLNARWNKINGIG